MSLSDCKVLRMFVSILTKDDKCIVLNRDNLRLSQLRYKYLRKKKFSQFLSAFLTARLNFENFQEKDDPHSSCISKYTDSEIRGKINV